MVTDLDRVAVELKRARSYLDVFGKINGDAATQAKHVKGTYRTLARVVHPDNYNGTDLVDIASDAFAVLEAHKREALEAIRQGTYGKPSGNLITTKRFKHHIGVTFTSGDVADLLQTQSIDVQGGETDSVCKLVRSPRDNDLLETEAKALKQLRIMGSNPDFHPFFPELFESLRLQSGKVTRRANMINRLEGFYSITQVMGAFPDGIDPLHMAWVWRRVLYALGYAHSLGVVHGAMVAPHIMVHPEQHGVVLIDWVYASVQLDGYQPALKAVPPAYRQWYPKEVMKKQPPSGGLDIQLAARTMVQLVGADPLTLEGYPDSIPPAMRTYFKEVIERAASANPPGAFDELEGFDELLKRLGGPYYPRRYRALRMPTGIR